MNFITILETNHNYNETILHYCQWDRNEVELEKLLTVLAFARECYDDGTCSLTFEFSRDLIPEAAARIHMKLNYDSLLFEMHTGNFKCPRFVNSIRSTGDEHIESPMTDPTACVKAIHKYFRTNGLCMYFH